MLNPKKNLKYQWKLHTTTGPNLKTSEIGFGHFLAMNTSWSWKRDSLTVPTESLAEFDIIKQNLNKWNYK